MTPLSTSTPLPFDVRYDMVSGQQHLKQFPTADLALGFGELHFQRLGWHAAEPGLSGYLGQQKKLRSVDQIGPAIWESHFSHQVNRPHKIGIADSSFRFIPEAETRPELGAGPNHHRLETVLIREPGQDLRFAKAIPHYHSQARLPLLQKPAHCVQRHSITQLAAALAEKDALLRKRFQTRSLHS
jgi:hypothetical protein